MEAIYILIVGIVSGVLIGTMAHKLKINIWLALSFYSAGYVHELINVWILK